MVAVPSPLSFVLSSVIKLDRAIEPVYPVRALGDVPHPTNVYTSVESFIFNSIVLGLSRLTGSPATGMVWGRPISPGSIAPSGTFLSNLIL